MTPSGIETATFPQNLLQWKSVTHNQALQVQNEIPCIETQDQ
jgi:hypothetical protein